MSTQEHQLDRVRFLARHAAELQGLRTALVGLLCLCLAALKSLSDQLGDSAAGYRVPGGLFGLIVVAWWFDDQLRMRYQSSLGIVRRRRGETRFLALVAVGVLCLAAALFDAYEPAGVRLSALLVAAIQFQIGVAAGEYRRHYVVSGGIWCVLALVPLTALEPAVRQVFCLASLGLTASVLGCLDHLALRRLLGRPEEPCRA